MLALLPKAYALAGLGPQQIKPSLKEVILNKDISCLSFLSFAIRSQTFPEQPGGKKCGINKGRILLGV